MEKTVKEFLQVWLAIMAGLLYFGVAAAIVYYTIQYNEIAGLVAIFFFASPIIAAWVMAMEEARQNRIEATRELNRKWNQYE